MSTPVKIAVAASLCVAAAAGAIAWMLSLDRKPIVTPALHRAVEVAPDVRKSNDPASFAALYIDKGSLEDAGVGFAHQFTGSIRDPKSLTDLREAVASRGRLGISTLSASLEQHLHLGPNPPLKQVEFGVKLRKNLGMLLMYEGKFADAAKMFEKAEAEARTPGISADLRTEMTVLRGIAAMRRGEAENCIECIGPSSCIFPIAAEAAHQKKAGSREAIEHFTRYLDERPGDLRVRWILNLAYMTLGEYPDKVPPKYLVSFDGLKSTAGMGRFTNVATLVGLTSRGPNMAGGSAMDDFTGDGLIDVFTTSLDAELGASLFVNKGDGTFEDRSSAAGLGEQIYCLNLAKADYDNDGDIDILMLRGAWDIPMRQTLLRNKGDGTFEDVTFAAGLGDPMSSEAAAWGDYDNDGLLDLYICGEPVPLGTDPKSAGDPKKQGRLYHNKGDGTFENVAVAAGVADVNYGKGVAWGDYDDDGKLDLFVSDMNGPSRLFHNDGDGKFTDVARSMGITPDLTFACWFFDYDNDGKLDLYVNGKGVALAENVADVLGMPTGRNYLPHLYHNLGASGFKEVSGEVGLEHAVTPMGCNFGDVDNDGFLDIYLGTGEMSFSGLVPNVMFKNMGGKKFEDVTVASGTGHLQKGHGVSFADWDNDGNLDLFVEAGGAAPGDNAYNLLFENPGSGHHWLKLKLVGTKTNRSAMGARIRAEVKAADGSSRMIYRTIGNNSSFGGNTLVELLGLLDAKSVSELEITWPTSKTRQIFRDVAADQSIEITEGVEAFKKLDQPRLKVPERVK